MKTLGFLERPRKRELFVICETDGCFVDGVTAATGCSVGHRTLRVEDYGKVAATFVETKTGSAIRIVPRPDVRERALSYAPGEPRRYFAQIQAYQTMPDAELLSLQHVILEHPVEQIRSRPGIRINCRVCGEEIINEREVMQNGESLCRVCAQGGYYQPALYMDLNGNCPASIERVEKG